MAHYLVYVRRSFRTAGDADVSDEAQVSAATAMLPAGATHDVIADSGGHHSGRTDDRDGLRELVRRIEERTCDGIAVYDLSRLARNARLTLNLHHALELAGIPLLIANMPNTRWDTATGRFMLGQLALAAQFQADQDSERAKGIRRSLFEDGRHRGNPPFGYRNGRDETNRRTLEVVPEQADVVQRIFAGLRHRSFAELADQLAAEGAPAPSAGGWTRYAVREVYLRATVYQGLVVSGRETRPGRHAPILSPDEARDALVGMASRQRGGRRPARHRTYLLAGLVRCECGRRMNGQAHGTRLERRYYLCRYCHRPFVRADELEHQVLEAIRRYRLPARMIAVAREALARHLAVPVSDDVDRARRRLEARLANLRKQHGWGDIDDATYRRERDETEAMLVQLPDGDKLVAFDRARATVLSMSEALDAMTPEEQRQAIALFVERVSPEGVVKWTPPVRPFYALAAGAEASVMVSRQGSDPAADDDPLEWYA